MKKQIIALTVVALAGVSSAFAQGYVTVASGNNYVWNEFTTPGSGVKGNANIDIAVYWAPVTTTDPLQQQGAGASQSVATNGVTSISSPANVNTALTGAGFTLATINGSGGTVIEQTIGATGNINYGQVQVQGMSLGGTYELVVVAWDAAAGATAITSGSYNAIGWSNPFSYTTGANVTDGNGTTLLNTDGMIKFGVAPVAATPEPGTMALAALGGASLLLFRRRNK